MEEQERYIAHLEEDADDLRLEVACLERLLIEQDEALKELEGRAEMNYEYLSELSFYEADFKAEMYRHEVGSISTEDYIATLENIAYDAFYFSKKAC